MSAPRPLQDMPPVLRELPESWEAAQEGRLRGLLLLHFLVCSVGLLGVLFGVSGALHGSLSLRHAPTVYNDWVLAMLLPQTPRILLFYAASLAGMAAYFAGVAFLVLRRPGPFLGPVRALSGRGPAATIAYVAALAAFNAAVAWQIRRTPPWPLPLSLLGVQGLWAAITFLPLYPAAWARREAWNDLAAGTVASRACLALLVGLSLQFVTVFLPYLHGPFNMMNEYLDIPEQTRLGDGLVDNAAYMNEHRLGGLTVYDAGRGAVPAPKPGTFAVLPRTPLLDRFVASHPDAYRYESSLRALVAYRTMEPDEQIELQRIVGTQAERDQVDRLAASAAREEAASRRRVYSAEESEFLRKNMLELHWKILNRWVLHHHNFVLGPINEYALGKPLAQINAQYGLFPVVMMERLLTWTGGINYRNYFRIWYAFWPLYYALFLGAAFVLLKDLRWVLLAAAVGVGPVLMINHHYLFLGPGLNPVRHFFDVAVAIALALYLRRGGAAAFAAALAMAVFSILNNQQFGLFLTAALLATLALKFLSEGRARAWEVWGAVAAAAAAAGIFLFASAGRDAMFHYYLEGFVSPPIGPARLYVIVFGFGLLFAGIVRYREAESEVKYVALFLLLYAQALTVYFVWGASNNHLLNILPVVGLAVVVALKFLVDQSELRPSRALIGLGLSGAALAGLYLPGLAAYYWTEADYRRVFADHKVYEWSMEKAQFRSTMDPAPFEQSVRLIQGNAKGGSAIHIISKYDAILPFLAGKYSAMPYFDVSWFLLTQKELDACVAEIRRARPEVLFVDSDIERNLLGEVVPEHEAVLSPYYAESVQRVQRLEKLRRVFDAVAADYEPAEKGGLLTVYRWRGGTR